jgi:predicted DCC family thiol-disulfide oxidoreductase YuxK
MTVLAISTESRLFAAAVACALLISAVVWRRALTRAVVDFFSAESGPLNLAIARIVFFAVALFSLPDPAVVAQYAELPDALIRPPQNLGAVLAEAPLERTWIDAAYIVAVISCVLGMLGLWTRTAAALLIVSSFYYLGVPQLYGKVNHYHHLLWFAAVFALSRSSDALSVGAVVRAARRPRHEEIADVPRGREYALPLRFMWLFLGLVYLFPGLGKYRFDGLQWLDPETVGYFMYLKWFETGYQPALLRPDEFPVLMTAGAAFTLLFETSFILLILFRRTRPVAVLAGLGFHNSTFYTMRIPFWSLQFLYVTLIDWENLSKRVFARRPTLAFVYHGHCGTCKRTVAVLQTIVLPGSVRFVDALDEEEVERAGLDGVDPIRLLTDVHAAVDGELFVGYDAYRRLAWRSPVLWPALPLLAMRPAKRLRNRVHRHGPDTRAPAIRTVPSPPLPAPRTRVAPLVLACCALLAVIAGIGVAGLRSMSANATAVNGWPLASYPTFAGVYPHTTTIMTLRAERPDGSSRPLDLGRRLDFMSSERRAGLLYSIVRTPPGAGRDRALRALVEYANPTTRASERIVILAQRVSIEPGRAGRVLSSKEVLRVAL